MNISSVISASPILAFLILAIVYGIGDFVGTRTKASIPSVFIVAILFLFGYWTFFPPNIVAAAGMGPPLGGVLSIMFCITHMGTSIRLKDLGKQWKIIVICLAGLVGMIIFVWFIAGLFVDKQYIISGLPPLAGGIVATTVMQEAATAAGMPKAAILAVCMYVMQGFVGYPITAFLLKREGRVLLKEYRAGEGKTFAKAGEVDSVDGKFVPSLVKKKLIPAIPEKYLSTAISLAKMLSVALLANLIQTATSSWGVFKLNQAVVVLILAVIACEIGYLEEDILRKNGCFNFLMFVLMIYVFSGLQDATPQMLAEIAMPLASIIVIGVTGMLLFSTIVSKVLKVSFNMACATSLTALYGFPPNYVLTEEASKALAENADEKQYLMDAMLPQMIVGGFVTVTITSVVLAGIFASMMVAL